MAQKEAQWAQRGSQRTEVEQRLTAFAIEEAISTFASEHPDLTDEEAIAALQAVQDAVEREVMSGINHEPNADGRVKDLALRILKNAQTMRKHIGIPHNVLLARVARLLAQKAILLSQRTRSDKGYLRALLIDIKPNSFEQLLNRLTAQQSRS